jgi:hypothetical protein
MKKTLPKKIKGSPKRIRGAAEATEKPKAVRLAMPTSEPILVKHFDSPPTKIRRDSIHPRRILPRIKEGKEREFHSLTAEVAFSPPAVMGFALRGATDELTLTTNTELPEPGHQHLASNVGEPSLVMNKTVALYTGNWYAAISIDGGHTFRYLDPFTAFPDPPNLGYCCDQVVNYVPSIDTFV